MERIFLDVNNTHERIFLDFDNTHFLIGRDDDHNGNILFKEALRKRNKPNIPEIKDYTFYIAMNKDETKWLELTNKQKLNYVQQYYNVVSQSNNIAAKIKSLNKEWYEKLVTNNSEMSKKKQKIKHDSSISGSSNSSLQADIPDENSANDKDYSLKIEKSDILLGRIGIYHPGSSHYRFAIRQVCAKYLGQQPSGCIPRVLKKLKGRRFFIQAGPDDNEPTTKEGYRLATEAECRTCIRKSYGNYCSRAVSGELQQMPLQSDVDNLTNADNDGNESNQDSYDVESPVKKPRKSTNKRKREAEKQQQQRSQQSSVSSHSSISGADFDEQQDGSPDEDEEQIAVVEENPTGTNYLETWQDFVKMMQQRKSGKEGANDDEKNYTVVRSFLPIEYGS